MSEERQPGARSEFHHDGRIAVEYRGERREFAPVGAVPDYLAAERWVRMMEMQQ